MITKCHHICGPGVPLPTKDVLAQQADLIHRTRPGNGSQLFSGKAEDKLSQGQTARTFLATATVKSRDLVKEMSCSWRVPSVDEAPSEKKKKKN